MSSMSSKRAHIVAPALFTRVSMRPNAATARSDHPAAVVLDGHVGHDHLGARAQRRAFGRDLLERRPVAGDERQHRALRRQLPRELRADALRRAGDDDDVVLHFLVSGSGMWLKAMCIPPRSRALWAEAK